MLSEIQDARQVPDEGFRRWFTDADNDLIIWFDDDTISGFQYCYSKFSTERAITWFEKSGFVHMKVDSGETGFAGPKLTPILVSDGLFDNNKIAKRFKEISGKVEPDLADFIYQKLINYPG